MLHINLQSVLFVLQFLLRPVARVIFFLKSFLTKYSVHEFCEALGHAHAANCYGTATITDIHPHPFVQSSQMFQMALVSLQNQDLKFWGRLFSFCSDSFTCSIMKIASNASPTVLNRHTVFPVLFTVHPVAVAV